MKTEYIIVGSGASAQSAIEAIRRNDKMGKIELFSRERSLSVKRTMLSKTPLKRIRKEGLENHDIAWFEEKKVELHLGVEVTEIDPDNHIVVTDKGEKREYGKLILSLGGTNFIPPIEGRDRDNVVSIHSEEELRELKRLALGKEKVAIIGGGVIGLELATELTKYNMSVTVLELAPYLMPGKLDKESSDYLISLIDDVRIMTGVNIKEITDEEVVLESEEKIPAELVVMCCGQIAETGLAKEAGLKTNRAIVVNERMETSDKDIYACGDCAEFEGFNYALWTEAIAQGRVAGENASGGDVIIEKFDHNLILTMGESSVLSMGDPGKNPQLKYECIREEKTYNDFSINDKPEKAYEARYYHEGKLKGAIVVGNLSGIKSLMGELK